MESDITELLRLTRAMPRALDEDDLARCASLVAERGRLLESLRARLGRGPAASLPRKLQDALAEMRTLDAALAERLNRDMGRVGRQLADLQVKSRHNRGGNPSVCLNRRA